jgi:hypothetical protein
MDANCLVVIVTTSSHDYLTVILKFFTIVILTVCYSDSRFVLYSSILVFINSVIIHCIYLQRMITSPSPSFIQRLVLIQLGIDESGSKFIYTHN